MHKRKILNAKLNTQKINTVLYWQRKCWGGKKEEIKKSKDVLPAVLWLQGGVVECLLPFN